MITKHIIWKLYIIYLFIKVKTKPMSLRRFSTQILHKVRLMFTIFLKCLNHIFVGTTGRQGFEKLNDLKIKHNDVYLTAC